MVDLNQQKIVILLILLDSGEETGQRSSYIHYILCKPKQPTDFSKISYMYMQNVYSMCIYLAPFSIKVIKAGLEPYIP